MLIRKEIKFVYLNFSKMLFDLLFFYELSDTNELSSLVFPFLDQKNLDSLFFLFFFSLNRTKHPGYCMTSLAIFGGLRGIPRKWLNAQGGLSISVNSKIIFLFYLFWSCVSIFVINQGIDDFLQKIYRSSVEPLGIFVLKVFWMGKVCNQIRLVCKSR